MLQMYAQLNGNYPKSSMLQKKGYGTTRYQALWPLIGSSTVGATVSIPFTYAKSFNPAEARYQDRKSEQNVTAIAHPS